MATYEETPSSDNQQILPGGRYCPLVRIKLKSPIEKLEKGLTTWSEEAANPDTTMRNCTAHFSIRIQTSITIERCQFDCYIAAYNEDVEGPGPEWIRLADSAFMVGRGSGFNAQCGGSGALDKTLMQELVIERCTFHAPLTIQKARRIVLKENRLEDRTTIGKHESLEMHGNTRNNKPFEPAGANK